MEEEMLIWMSARITECPKTISQLTKPGLGRRETGGNKFPGRIVMMR